MTQSCANLAPASRRLLLILALLASSAAPTLEPAGVLRDFPRNRVILVTAERCSVIDVWVAATPAHHAQGLMFVTEMADHEGMLFLYGKARVIAMWMKNTFIPLDMLFATTDGEIKHIHRDAIPHDTTVISSEEAVSVVVELNAGRADALGIRPGDRLVVPLFN